MSGGSYDYAYRTAENMAEQMLRQMPAHRQLNGRWFAAHLHLVAMAKEAIEWEDSGDSGSEDTQQAEQMDHTCKFG